MLDIFLLWQQLNNNNIKKQRKHFYQTHHKLKKLEKLYYLHKLLKAVMDFINQELSIQNYVITMKLNFFLNELLKLIRHYGLHMKNYVKWVNQNTQEQSLLKQDINNFKITNKNKVNSFFFFISLQTLKKTLFNRFGNLIGLYVIIKLLRIFLVLIICFKLINN